MHSLAKPKLQSLKLGETDMSGSLTRALATAAVIGALSTSVAAQTTLTVSTYVTSKHWTVAEGLARWANEVKEATNGRLTINILATSLGRPEAHFELARDGIADIALTVPGYSPGRFVLTEVGSLPGVAAMGLSRALALWRTVEKFPELRAEFAGVAPLAAYTTTPMHVFNVRRNIQTLEDFSGLKLHVAGGVMSDVARSLGAVPVAQPTASAYEVISRGVVDGIIFTSNGVHAFNLHRLVKHATLVPGGLTAAPIILVMNQAKFDNLRQNDREALIRVSGENISRIIGTLWDAYDFKGIQALREAGVEPQEVSPQLADQISKTSRPVIEKWVADAKEKRSVDAKPILEYYVQQAKVIEAAPQQFKKQ
jgi:TRAP-type C4-dicarboxylate transport system substrate-binding protein